MRDPWSMLSILFMRPLCDPATPLASFAVSSAVPNSIVHLVSLPPNFHPARFSIMSAAFVPGASVPLASQSSAFLARSCGTPSAPAAAAPATGATALRANILDGLDTVSQQPYSFSRNILGPFSGQTLAPARDGSLGAAGERETALKAVYRHVFGNAYIMEEERAELAVAESQFLIGELTMREFVRALGKSSTYKVRFFEGASMYRFTELNYMHFLGRAPDDHKEISAAQGVYHADGVDACIDALVDSEEYSSVFGDDTIPFLRFRGAYTPCGSFGMQLAIKGGWANSDKAMGGAALSGYNGSDGRQMSTFITAHIKPDEAQAPYETLAENTPLKTTSPNWYAVPDPALEPEPAFVSPSEVSLLESNLAALQSQYAAAIAARAAGTKGSVDNDPLQMFREMTRDMSTMLERGPSFSGGDPLNINPFSRDMLLGESPLAEGGCKSSDFLRYGSQMESNNISRLERDIEVAKGKLRVLQSALDKSQPMTPSISIPGVAAGAVREPTLAERAKSDRPTIKIQPVKTTSAIEAAAAAAAAASKPTITKAKRTLPGGITLPDMPKVSLPAVPKLPGLPNPFAKKD